MSPYPWISEKPASPTPIEPDAGRTATGQFAKGNKGGPGNPYNRQVAAIRRALLDAVTLEEIHYLARGLMDRALEGNLAAAKLLLSYLIGKPGPAAEPDTLDLQEWHQHQAAAVTTTAVNELLNTVPAATANAIARIIWPIVARGHIAPLVEGLHAAEAAAATPAPPAVPAAPVVEVPPTPVSVPEQPSACENVEPTAPTEPQLRAPTPRPGRPPSANGSTPHQPGKHSANGTANHQAASHALPPPDSGTSQAASDWQRLLQKLLKLRRELPPDKRT